MQASKTEREAAALMKNTESGGQSWYSRRTDPHQDTSSLYLNPRQAPVPTSKSSFRSLNSVFRHQKPPKPPSLLSVHSNLSVPDSVASHPYAAMHVAPMPVVSSTDGLDDEEDCPVCLEPLSFSFRLPGEKPHIVPECGHALHEACFTAVYGPPPNQSKSAVPRKSNLGVCGVCRRPMKVGDGDGGKSNKLAALTGVGDQTSSSLYPGRDTPTNRRRPQVQNKPFDPNEDDPLDHTGSVKSDPSRDHSQYIVAPSIQVRPEFSSITRTHDANQPLTCIVVIELPGKRVLAPVPGPVLHDYNRRDNHLREDTGHEPQQPRRQLPSESYSQDLHYSGSSGHGHDSSSPQTALIQEEDSPFNAITEDLRNRIIDWKGHPLSDLGPLQMYDLLSVRRDSLVREFYVYLFKEALICVVEEKKRSLGRLLSNASGLTDASSTMSAPQSKGVLRLKGRIYVRHIKQVTASSAAGEMSLTIDMEDELASFILIFKDRSSLEAWRNTIQTLVNMFQSQNQSYQQPQQVDDHALDMEEFGGNSKAMRMLSGSTSTTVSSGADSLLQNGSSRSTMSSSTSHGSALQSSQRPAMQHKLTPLGEADEASQYDSPTGLVTPYTSSGPSNSLTPLPHPAMDLILVVSLPPSNASPSTALLKIRVIKATLDFIIASLGQKDRLSLVTFEVGHGGRVRKTPFLSASKAQSKARLERFIEDIPARATSDPDGVNHVQDEFLVRVSKDEKTDVVTAVNHGLDVVLQRKARNSISGMILVSDASDSTRRAQMDLVLARAEAANVPIHSFGYGRSHDPASLWLMSNHTSGTYTFVKDWYDLRDSVAGCVGGMMSIGLLNMKLHMKIVDGNRFRIRKVSGGPSSILASDGQNVDVDVGELRYGERKEMLIELELDNSDLQQRLAQAHGNGHRDMRNMNATDRYVQSMGLDALTIDDGADFTSGMLNGMIDEVPVVEVDGSFFDPAAAKNVTRLAHPVLLTVTLLPPSSNTPKPPSSVSDPVIVRRRMELLASDMITRALVLVSRRNFPQAQKIISETKRILHTVLQTISRSLPPPNSGNSRNRKELLILGAVRAMQAILQDLQILSEAMEDNVDLFAHDQRNFGAQQAMILRDQKSWTGRSATERLFWTTDNSIELVSRSTDWIARDHDASQVTWYHITDPLAIEYKIHSFDNSSISAAMAGTSKLRQRNTTSGRPTFEYDRIQEEEHTDDVYQNPNTRHPVEQFLETEKASVVVVAVLTALAFALRFYKINHPDQVVFDEVHFGKFASYYILGEYYFDVHPPFAKLLFGLAGWFSGFDGHFQFENIGDSYTQHHVPYVGMRALPAILGSLTVPVVYAIMKQSGYSTVIAAFSASLILFDNAHIAQSRLILLDATLIFFMSLTIYAYIRFQKLRYREFTTEWFGWLFATGFFMACAWGSKVNGVLTVATVGVAVLIDLWGILDIKKSPSMDYFWRHFAARAVGLIVIPFIIYLSFFWVHFALLPISGTGDSFMSPAFQETLAGNEMLMNSQEIRYYDTVTIKHKDTKGTGQQVTGYGHDDTNNEWQIIPTKALPETGRGRVVRQNDMIQFLHANTNTVLLTHDVASPLMPTNQEFTTWPRDDTSRFNETLFQLVLLDGNGGDAWKSKSGYFRLVHGVTKVSMWTHNKQLPEWAFRQQEINGNKNPSEKTATWFVEDIVADETGEDPKDRAGAQPAKVPKKMNFFRKFGELQLLMMQHNAGLTASHPYASGPLNWPFLISGISFWTENDPQKQIYLIGNLVGWWACVVALSIYIGILGADLLARRRNNDPIPELYLVRDDQLSDIRGIAVDETEKTNVRNVHVSRTIDLWNTRTMRIFGSYIPRNGIGHHSSAMPQVLDNALDAVGKTPLIRLDRVAKFYGLKCNLCTFIRSSFYSECSFMWTFQVGKVEYMSAGGSVKDRIAKAMVESAEKEGKLIPGQSVVIEPTSGNTGIGLAMACAIKEKEAALRALGAEVVRTPTEAAWNSPESHIGVAKRLQKAIPGGIILDQYANVNNPLAHELTTGPEIIEAVTSTPSISGRPSSQKVDAVVCGAGTGGTITGISRSIKKTHNKDCIVVGVDPEGSILAFPESLNTKTEGTPYVVEGIGYDFVPDVLSRDPAVIDEWVKTTDNEAFEAVQVLMRNEGLLVGGSSGTALCGMLKWLRTRKDIAETEGLNIVVLLPDGIRNYIGKDWFLDRALGGEPTALAKTIANVLQKSTTNGVKH
ncbi:hypothetical protein D9757_005775 [Collybiopsis confluens]|uniref:Dolichyl-phosphate-mannose--protein mannosyltransferase n=1 Tax=Collybiopsis confluens TaxID=2823264 RepID=A0A8H5HPR5_9AGAR|nr:hypothetical protein D9757_005775 [Collybiopsis confluens]